MPIIESVDSIEIGPSLTLTLRGSEEPQECYLIQNRILLPEPITLFPNEGYVYRPEAPGNYVVKGKDFEKSFDVVMDLENESGPVLADGTWFPSTRAAALGRGYESAAMAILPEIVNSGSVVYDIGGNIGLYARQFSRLVGADGQVYCFEPNPIALHYLSHNLAVCKADNYLIFPIALSDKSGSVDLVINPDNQDLGSMVFEKRGIHLNVQSIALDEAIARFRLRPPDVIKMDIEGGEVWAIKGMVEAIKQHRPVVLFELHGRDNAAGTLSQMNDYFWQFPGEERIYLSEALSEAFPEACVQVIGRPMARG